MGKLLSICLAIVIVLLIYLISDEISIKQKKEIEKKYDSLKSKGQRGEFLTFMNLKSFMDYGSTFLFNLYIPTSNGETSEIDQIMICKKGIIVIESKNYSGMIYGDDHSHIWTQVLLRKGSNEKNHFYNPILQNQNHIKNLRNVLEEEIPMFSLIVFADYSKLKKVPENTRDVKITKRNYVKSTVTKIFQENKDALNEDQITKVFNDLYKYTVVSKEQKEKHIEDIRSKYNTY